MVHDLFDVLLIWFANILLRIFASILIRDICLQYSFFMLSLSGFGIRLIDAGDIK